MPHFELRYSRNLAEQIDISLLCGAIADMMRAEPMFPIAGIRIRALPCDAYVIADGHPQNTFLDMTLRIGAGREEHAKMEMGKRLFDAIAGYLQAQFETPHFALSFEVQETNPALSWKKNSIHARLRTHASES